MNWRHQAVCRDKDPNLWTPAMDSPGVVLAIAKAKAICAGCPVRSDCLDEGLRRREWGVWGGLIKEERDEIRAKRKKTA